MIRTNPFRRFLKDERASISVEAVLILPLLLWAYFGMFILFDGFRALSANTRVGYTVSDMLSRTLDPVDAAYIDGLNTIQGVLSQSPQPTVLRVTVVRYSDLDDDGVTDPGEHSLEWSYSTVGQNKIEASELDDKIVPFLPPMPSSSILVVVETWMAFSPFMNITMEQFYAEGPGTIEPVFGPFFFESLVVTRMRFSGQLCWETCAG